MFIKIQANNTVSLKFKLFFLYKMGELLMVNGFLEMWFMGGGGWGIMCYTSKNHIPDRLAMLDGF